MLTWSWSCLGARLGEATGARATLHDKLQKYGLGVSERDDGQGTPEEPR